MVVVGSGQRTQNSSETGGIIMTKIDITIHLKISESNF
jgi:hypothetical protein